jgi:hypothetical protein
VRAEKWKNEREISEHCNGNEERLEFLHRLCTTKGRISELKDSLKTSQTEAHRKMKNKNKKQHTNLSVRQLL